MRESDDDLASFLSGLRAKYNQLFPASSPAPASVQQQHGTASVTTPTSAQPTGVGFTTSPAFKAPVAQPQPAPHGSSSRGDHSSTQGPGLPQSTVSKAHSQQADVHAPAYAAPGSGTSGFGSFRSGAVGVEQLQRQVGPDADAVGVVSISIPSPLTSPLKHSRWARPPQRSPQGAAPRSQRAGVQSEGPWQLSEGGDGQAKPAAELEVASQASTPPDLEQLGAQGHSEEASGERQDQLQARSTLQAQTLQQPCAVDVWSEAVESRELEADGSGFGAYQAAPSSNAGGPQEGGKLPMQQQAGQPGGECQPQTEVLPPQQYEVPYQGLQAQGQYLGWAVAVPHALSPAAGSAPPSSRLVPVHHPDPNSPVPSTSAQSEGPASPPSLPLPGSDSPDEVGAVSSRTARLHAAQSVRAKAACDAARCESQTAAEEAHLAAVGSAGAGGLNGDAWGGYGGGYGGDHGDGFGGCIDYDGLAVRPSRNSTELSLPSSPQVYGAGDRRSPSESDWPLMGSEPSHGLLQLGEVGQAVLEQGEAEVAATAAFGQELGQEGDAGLTAWQLQDQAAEMHHDQPVEMHQTRSAGSSQCAGSSAAGEFHSAALQHLEAGLPASEGVAGTIGAVSNSWSSQLDRRYPGPAADPSDGEGSESEEASEGQGVIEVGLDVEGVKSVDGEGQTDPGVDLKQQEQLPSPDQSQNQAQDQGWRQNRGDHLNENDPDGDSLGQDEDCLDEAHLYPDQDQLPGSGLQHGLHLRRGVYVEEQPPLEAVPVTRRRKVWDLGPDRDQLGDQSGASALANHTYPARQEDEHSQPAEQVAAAGELNSSAGNGGLGSQLPPLQLVGAGTGGRAAAMAGSAEEVSGASGSAPASASASASAPLQSLPAAEAAAALGTHTHEAEARAMEPSTTFTAPGVAERPGATGRGAHELDWLRVNRLLLDAGFAKLRLRQGGTGTPPQPELADLYFALHSVVEQYSGQARMIQDLLVTTEQGQEELDALTVQTRRLERELAQARQEAERAARDALQVSSLQLPRAEAQHKQQVTRLKADLAKCKAEARTAEEACALKDSEIASLQQCITSLQAGAMYTADAEMAALKQRLKQLETALKAKDREVEKTRSMQSASQVETNDELGKAMSRAFAAEDALSKLEQESQQLKTRQLQLEQALRARDKDFASLKEETTAAIAIDREAAAAASGRASAAEEAVRKLEGEAAGLRAKVGQLEAALRTSQKEAARLKVDAEAMRQAAYEELWKAEDDIRTLNAELSHKSSKITQLEHASRAKDREVAKAREERETGRAAERERAKVAEEVAVKLEMELTQARVKGAQLEGSLRNRERELARLNEQLSLSKGVEVDVRSKGSKVEEGVRKLEADVTTLRTQRVQLESNLKARDRDIDRLGKTVEQLKGELHDTNARNAQFSEAIKRLEMEAAQGRSRALQLEGAVRVKDRELERLTRCLEAARGAEAEAGARQAKAEEAGRKLEEELANARVQLVQLDASLKAKAAQVERLSKLLDSNRAAEYESTADLLKTEETARKLDSDMSTLSRRLVQLEGAIKARDKEIERQARAAEAARAGAAEAEGRRAAAEEAARKVEGELAAARQRAAQAEGATRAAEREMERLGRAVEAAKGAEAEATARVLEREAAVAAADGEAAGSRQRAAQAEGALKAKEREVERLSRAVEAAGVAEAAARLRQEEAEAGARRAEGEAADLRARLAQSEGAVKAKERQVEKLERSLEQSRAAVHEADSKASKAAEAARQAEGDAAAARQKLAAAEAALKSKEKEVERLQRMMDNVRSTELDGADKIYEAEGAARAAEGEAAAARQRCVQLEGTIKAKEREVERLGRAVEAARAAEAEALGERRKAEEAAEKLEGELAGARQKLTAADALGKVKDREVERAGRAAEAAKAAEANAVSERLRAEEAGEKLQAELAAARQKAAAAEALSKAKDKEVERAGRAVEVAKAGEAAAVLERLKAEEAREKVLAELAAARQKLAAIETNAKARDKDAERVGRTADAARAGEAAAVSERLRTEEAAEKLQVELTAARQRAAAAESAVRARDKEVERLGRAAEAARAGAAESLALQLQAEEAVRLLDAELAAAGKRVGQLETVMKAREREIEGLQRSLEQLRGAEALTGAQKDRSDEAARKLDAELAAARQRVVQLEGMLQLRERELERAKRAMQEGGADAAAHVAKTEETVRVLERNVAQMRARLQTLQANLKGRDSKVARLTRMLEAARGSNYNATSDILKREEAVRVMDAELSRMKERMVQLEAALKGRDKEVDRLGRALEVAKVAEAEYTVRQSALEAASRQVDVQLAALRQRLVQMQSSSKAKQREAEGLQRQLEAARAEGYEAASARLQAEEAARQLEGELASARQAALLTEQGAKARAKEVEQLRKQVDRIHAAEHEASAQAALHAESALKLEAELAAARQRAAALEVCVKGKEADAARLARQLDKSRSGEAEEAAKQAQSDEAFRRLEHDLSSLAKRATQLEGLVRAREREVERLQGQAQGEQADRAELEGRCRKLEEGARKREGELAAARQLAAQAEGAARVREREVERLGRAVVAAEAAAAEAAVGRQQAEEEVGSLEREVAAARRRAAQQEALVRARERDAAAAQKLADAARAGEREAVAARGTAEAAARAAEGEAGASKQRCLQLEASVRVKEREVEKLAKQIEVFQSAEYQAISAKLGTEEAARKLQADIVSLRGQASQLEAARKVRDREVERLSRSLEGVQGELREAAAKLQEAERQLQAAQAEGASARARAAQLEGAAKGREKEVARAQRAVEAAVAAQEEARAAAAAAAAGAKAAEGEAAALRSRAIHLESLVKVKDREIERLSKALECAKEAEYQVASQQLQAEEAARQLDAELAAARSRTAQAEAQLRVQQKETAALAKALEAARGGEGSVAGKAAAAEEAARKLDGDVGSLRQRVLQLEGVLKLRDKEVERLGSQAEAAGAAASDSIKQAEEQTREMKAELATVRQRCVQLEGGAAAHRAEVARLNRLLDQTKASEYEFSAKALAAEEAVREAGLELARARQRGAQLEAAVKARETELRNLTRELEGVQGGQFSAEAGAVRAEGALREAREEAAAAKAAVRAAEAAARVKEGEVREAVRKLEAERAEAALARIGAERAEEAARKAEAEAAALRTRVSGLEAAVKARDKEVERLGRAVEADRGAAEVAAERASARTEAAAAKLEAQLSQTKARATQLESALVSRDKEIEGLQRMLDSARLSAHNAGDGSSGGGGGFGAGVDSGAGQQGEQLRRLEAELAASKSRLHHLEHVCRSKELAVDKIRGILADKVAKEERRMSRDKAVYASLKQAWLVSKEEREREAALAAAGPAGGVAFGRGAAGAVSAAVREMRPVEIVGLYEVQREGLDAELAAAKSEVRLLCEQLRDAQNLIAAKDRQGAWRGPEELATLQGRVMLAERRAAELQRELDAARSAAVSATQSAEARVRAAEQQHRQMADEAAALRAELQGRPTADQTRGLQREVAILERRLQELRGGSRGGPGAAGAGGEDALASKTSGLGSGAGKSAAVGRDLMRRDREVHRLGLRGVEDLSRDVLVDVVQDVCVELEVRDATSLPAAVRSMMRVVSAAPRMEHWIGDVCQAVYGEQQQQGQEQPALLDLLGQVPVSPASALTAPQKQAAARRDPSVVPAILAAAAGALREAVAMRSTLSSIGEALMQRPDPAARSALRSPSDAVAAVRQLVAVERDSHTSRASWAAATAALASPTDMRTDVLPGLVSHFMKLFECGTVEGVGAAMNKVYVTLSQQRNFLRDLAGAVGLAPEAGLTAIMEVVVAAVTAAAATAATASSPAMQTDGTQSQARRRGAEGAQAMPSQAHSSNSNQGSNPRSNVDPDALEAMHRLCGALGVPRGGWAQAVAVGERLVDRLRRLDEVLPRYQRVAGQLYEVLRVHTLDEVVPAVERLAAAVAA